jgi:vacuolar-type H+-ATPase subunit H
MEQTTTEVSKKFKQEAIELTRKSFGDKAADFMEFVFTQNVQMEVMSSMIDVASDMHNPDIREAAIEAMKRYSQVYGSVQSVLTEKFANASELSHETAKRIFDTANDTYETILAQVKKPDQTND